jgi:hypothetical protein
VLAVLQRRFTLPKLSILFMKPIAIFAKDGTDPKVEVYYSTDIVR